MFSAWLQPVLHEKDIDYDVYGSYIVSILEDEEDDCHVKKESINEILQSSMVSILCLLTDIHNLFYSSVKRGVLFSSCFP